MTTIHADLESNPHNDAGTAMALYFPTTTKEEVGAACAHYRGKLPLSVTGEPEYEIVPSPISDLAKVVRVLVFNIG